MLLPAMKIVFWSAWVIDAIVAIIVLTFFFIGLGDHTVSSYNAGIWAAMLIGVAAVLIGSCLLRAYVHPIAGLIVALVLAIPALGALAFLLLILITQPRMN